MKDHAAYRNGAVPKAVRIVATGLLIPTLLVGLLAIFDGKALAAAFSIVTCNSSNPCTGGSNSGSGAGVSGTSAKGFGVMGKTTSGTAAVYGTTSTTSFLDAAVFGKATNNANGVEGSSVNNSGVYGTTTNGIGVEGISNNATGVYGQGTIGLYASSPLGGTSAIYALGASTDGAQIYSDSTRGIYAQNGCGGACLNSSPTIEAVSDGAGEGVQSFTSGQLAGRFENNGGSPQGDGVEIYGQYIGLISRAPAGGGTYPYVATDLNNNDLFYIDGNGNVYYHGSLINFARTRDGNIADTFETTSTTPSIEDNGTARLSFGIAHVALNPAFARTIDPGRPYQVMITPGGDTRGLYVMQKGSTYFTVREVEGGHSSISFDYHVYATKLGYANNQMTEMSPSMLHSFEPRARTRTVRPQPVQPIKISPHK